MSSLITDQSIDYLLINGTITDTIDYSSFDCILFNIFNSFSIMFILFYLLIPITLIGISISSLFIPNYSIIGSYSTFYLPLFSDLLLIMSINSISLFILLIELIPN